MLCRNCGLQIPDDSVYCYKCGVSVLSDMQDGSNQYICPNCGYRYPLNSSNDDGEKHVAMPFKERLKLYAEWVFCLFIIQVICYGFELL